MVFQKDELEKLAAADVMSKPEDKEAAEIEQKIKDLQRGSTVQIKLNQQQMQRAQREAATMGLDYKQFIRLKVNEMLEGDYGRATIAGPSWASGGRKVTGPSSGAIQ